MSSNSRGRVVLIDLFKEDMKFSAGHFTIFSATERERLHGHNFTLGARILGRVDEGGLCFDYGIYKNILSGLCREWNEYFLLPGRSPHLRVEDDGSAQITAHFNGERIPFPRSDVLVLPVANVTLEELSHLILERLTHDRDKLRVYGIEGLSVRVFSGPGQYAESGWGALCQPEHAAITWQQERTLEEAGT